MMSGTLTSVTQPKRRPGARGRPRTYGGEVLAYDIKCRLPAVLLERLDREVTRRVAVDPAQRPLPTRGGILREALEAYLEDNEQVPSDPPVGIAEPALTHDTKVRLTPSLLERLDRELTRWIAFDPAQRPLPGRGHVLRQALDLYLTRFEREHGQPDLPFTELPHGGASTT